MARALPENVKFTCPIQEKKLKNMFPRMEDVKLDVILTTYTDNTSISANRAILSASSRCVSETLSTVSEDYAEIKIPIINGADLTSIWNFMRTGVIELDSKNAKTILMGADFFRLNGLVEKCTSFLKDRLDEFNCLDVFAIAYKYEMSQLKGACLRYAKDHDIHTKETFFRLNKQQLEDFLDNAEIEPHVQVYYCLLDWYRHDTTNRCHLMNDLMSMYVDIQLLKGKAIISEWNMAHKLPDIRKDKILLIHCNTNRVPDLLVQSYDTERELWSYQTWKADPTWKTGCTKFLIDKRMFVSGGRDEFGTYNYVSYFDVEYEEYHQLSPMLTARSGHTMLEINRDLYVLGGVDELKELIRSVDRYDFSTKIWTTVSTLPEGLSDCYKASSADGRLFVAARDNNGLACYDPIANEWTLTEKLDCGKKFNMTSVRGRIYVFDNQSYNQYNSYRNTWKYYYGVHIGLPCTVWNDRLLYFQIMSLKLFDPETGRTDPDFEIPVPDKRRDKRLTTTQYVSVYN